MGSRYRLPKSFHIHINNRIPEFTNTFTHSRILSPFYVGSLCLIRRNVVNFATWVANSMLNQHLLRFQVESTGSNTNRWEDILEALPDEFSRSEAESLLASHNVGTPLKQVIYSWKLAGLIKDLESGRLRNGKPGIVRFKKTSST